MPSPISFFNNLGRKRTEFLPLLEDKVGMYTCGLTVYGRGHIGNFRSFIFADILRRTLEGSGYDVTHVINITDVGHLTDDADAGADKLEVASKKTGKTAWDIAKEFTDLYHEDAKKLHLLSPHVEPKATEHIREQIAMIEEMEKRGFTYQITDGIYFDTSKLPSYGQLSGQKSEEKEEGTRIAVNSEKRHPSDFALWKFSPADEQRQMEWESPWGVGFPGWHIECSAMAGKYLGTPFDIHTGGVDHIAVHHENELAQTEAAKGELEARYWLHNEFVMVDGGKMSKSLGNTFSLDDLAAHGISPLAYKYFLLGAHYRTTLNFTWDAVTAAQNALAKLEDLAQDLPADTSRVHEATAAAIDDALRNDLDTPAALAALWTMLGDDRIAAEEKAGTLKLFDDRIDLGLIALIGHPVKASAEAQSLMAKREEARQNKDFALSDQLRDELKTLGYRVEDTPQGPRLRIAR